MSIRLSITICNYLSLQTLTDITVFRALWRNTSDLLNKTGGANKFSANPNLVALTRSVA